MAVTVDHICGGRLEFGLGAAWHEAEHRGYGIPFPRAGERIAMLDEALRVITALWTEDTASFDGRYFRLQDAICNPKPVQKPHPPIVVAGQGEKMSLRVVATHTDEWNATGIDAADWSRLNQVLTSHCEAIGRDPATIRRGVQLHPSRERAPNAAHAGHAACVRSRRLPARHPQLLPATDRATARARRTVLASFIAVCVAYPLDDLVRCTPKNPTDRAA